jgi:hypothetical protein
LEIVDFSNDGLGRLYIDMLEKCHLLKLWHVIEAARKKFLPKMLIFSFCEDAYSSEIQNTVFCSKLF